MNSKMRKTLQITAGILLCTGMAYCTNYDVGSFKSWAQGLVKVLTEGQTFIKYIATAVGMFMVTMGLMQVKKAATPQGAQQEASKHAVAHIIIGVCLICLIPMVQMFQADVMSGAGNTKSKHQAFFEIDGKALSDSE